MIQADPAPQVEGPFPLSTLRHSTAHLMASAVQKLFPDAQFGFGPAIEHGFYYDFDLPEPLTDKDLRKIEKEMRRIAKRSPKIERESLTREEARGKLKEWGQLFKLEALDLIPEDEEVTFYFHGEEDDRWGDLCRGPHVDGFKD
ncbi:MAG: threonine--tRNA ligase, partial [Planctomycetota bacterium]